MVSRHAGVVLLAIGLATVALGAYVAFNLQVNSDEDAMLSGELPHRIFELQYHELFPALYENIVIVLDADTPELARDGAASLVAGMRAEPDVFASVYFPEGEFFQEHALLYLETEELEDFADRLARFQPYLGELSRDGSLRGLTMLTARGIRGVREREASHAEIGPLFERFSAAVRAQLSGQEYRMSWAEVLAERTLDADARRRIVLVQPVLDFSDISPARKPINRIRELSAEVGPDPDQAVRVRMTGDVALAFEEMQIVEGQARWAGITSFVLVFAILFGAMRSARLVFGTTTTLIVGLVWTAAFAAVAIGHLNLLSVSFAVLYIGLGVDFGVHFCMRYQELWAQGSGHDEALRETARGVGASLVLCAVTTAIGFYAFVPTDFAGVAELGLIAGTGMFISLFLSFTFLPAFISVRRGHAPPLRSLGNVPPLRSLGNVPSLPTFPVRYPRGVGSVALLLGAASMLLIPRIQFDQNPLRVRDPAAESVQALEELLERRRATPWELNAVAEDLESAEALASELTKLDTVDRAITVSHFVPDDQAEKLAIIQDVALFLAPPPAPDGVRQPPSYEEQIAGLTELRDELGRWMRDASAPSVPDFAARVYADLARLLQRLEANADPALIAALEKSLIEGLPRHLEELDTVLNPESVTLESLPPSLLSRMVSQDGKVRVRVFPSQDLGDNAEMERFVTSVREVAGDVQGGAVNIYEASQAVIRALRQAFISAIVVITVLLLLIWRAVADTALVLIPLGLAAVFTSAGAVVIGIPFNFADVIVLPLLLGIGVDSGIHLVHRSRLQHAAGDLLGTSTARAVVVSSVTTIASFGTLGFASHLGMASLGQLLALGVTLTVVCNLGVLPALIAWRERIAGPRAKLVS